MDKAELVKALKAELRKIGFVYKQNMFEFKETHGMPIQFVLSIQKKASGGSFKINPSIVIQNPLANPPERLLLVLANLEKDGLRLHVRAKSWWSQESVMGAPKAIRRFAVPWFREWSQLDFLIAKVELAISERKSLRDVFEPLTHDEQEVIERSWPRIAEVERRAAPLNLRFASIL